MILDPLRLIRLLVFSEKKNISNSQSKQFNKEKANKNEPLDIQGKATHQLIVKPIYPGLQLKLLSILKKKKSSHTE